jgi:hypothetical protein
MMKAASDVQDYRETPARRWRTDVAYCLARLGRAVKPRDRRPARQNLKRPGDVIR